jgi:sec-independent protein translocase protein TatB
MNVFGVGPMELIVILVVALIFVGPERLPRFAADVARLIRDVRRYTGGLASEFNQVMKELEQETEADRAEWKEIGEGLADATKGVASELNAAQTEASAALAPAPESKRDPTQAFLPPAANNGASPQGASAPVEPKPAESAR